MTTLHPARTEQDRKQGKNEMVGEASFTVASDDPLRKNVDAHFHNYELCWFRGMFPPVTQK